MMAAIRQSATCSLPIVVILGSTGAGKSKLAIEIAKKFNGQIISADSMQVYKGLDIVTNKVSPVEQTECKHHFIDYISPLNVQYTVTDYQRDALPIIDTLLQENILPIIVGGTNYYIESLLWNYLLTKTQDDSSLSDTNCNEGSSSEIDHNGLKHTLPVVALSKKTNSSWSSDVTDGESTNKKQKLKDFTAEKNVSENVFSTECTQDVESRKEISSNTNDLPKGDNRYTAETLPFYKDTTNSSKSCKVYNQQHVPITEPINNTDWNTLSDRKVDQVSRKTSPLTEKALAESKDGDERDTNTLFTLLQKVDPDSAKRLHPKNRRKILRAVQVFEQHGVTMTKMFELQHGQEPGLSGPLRYPNVCVLWIQCQQEVLDKRLDNRVDEMMSRGLIKELDDFHRSYNLSRKSDSSLDYTIGIFQNIGFKEFHNYLILPEEEKSSCKGKQLLQDGIEDLKRATRRYAKKQTRWVKNRFLKRPGKNTCPVYSLDGTDIAQWKENVYSPAVEIVTAILQGETPSQKPLPIEADNRTVSSYNVCEVCDGRVFVTLHDWHDHLNSRKHKKRLHILNRKSETPHRLSTCSPEKITQDS